MDVFVQNVKDKIYSVQGQADKMNWEGSNKINYFPLLYILRLSR